MEDARIAELEVRMAYQERLVQELSQLAFQQSKAIERLEAHSRSLGDKLKEMGDGKPSLPSNERPPHY